MNFFKTVTVTVLWVYLLVQITLAIVSVDEYCDKFPKSLRPMICLLNENVLVPVNSSSTTGRPTTRSWGPHPGPFLPGPPPPPGPPPGVGWQEPDDSSSEEDEEVEDATTSCSCDLTCIPPPGTADAIEGEDLVCKPCGNNCDVSTSVNPKCSCAAVGSALSPPENLLKQKCSCSVTCATSPWENEDPFCIFNITGLIQATADEKPVNCECCKSKSAQHNEYPDFVCVCQKI